MSRRPRRNHTSAFWAKVAIAAIKGDRGDQGRPHAGAAVYRSHASLEAQLRRDGDHHQMYGGLRAATCNRILRGNAVVWFRE
jgi:hypothetical protein